MSIEKGNFLLRLVKQPNKTKRIKYRIVNGELTLSLAKTSGVITTNDLNEWSKNGWYIESDNVERANAMLCEISDGRSLISVQHVQMD